MKSTYERQLMQIKKESEASIWELRNIHEESRAIAKQLKEDLNRKQGQFDYVSNQLRELL